MTVSERLRSCWGPTWLARRSPVKQASEITSIAFEWTTKRFLWCPFQCVEWWRPHQSLQPSFMALSSRAIFMFRWIRLSVTRKTHLERFYGSVIISLFTICHVKKLACFCEPQFGRILLNISPPHSVWEAKRTSGKSVTFDLPLPACFTTEQGTIKASLFVKYNATQACSMEKLTDLYNLLTFEYITLLACLKESHVNYNDSRES